MRVLTAGLMVCVLSTPVLAANPVWQMRAENFPESMFALGAGLRFGDSPYAGLDDIGSVVHSNSFDLLPFYYYDSSRGFINGNYGGVHLFNGDTFQLNAVLSYRFDRLESEADDYFFTVEDREQTLEGGFAGTFKGDWGALSLSWLTDTLDKHNGEEFDLSYRYQWQQGKWTLSPFVSLVHQDRKLTDYYYGVSEEEARDDLPAYAPGASEILRGGINTTYAVSKRMRLMANFSLDVLDDTIADSPLVDEDVIPSAMLGFNYALGGKIDDDRASPTAAQRVGEWSWRINYGYTAEENFLRVHRGEFTHHKGVDTKLVGLTLGKLFFDGDRADYWGKLSLNKRLENDLQEDFYELNGYLMIMGTGYSPWTSRELFRYGFGYGLSYAEDVPYVEYYKQIRRDENTSRFLNYLEAQLDFPLRNLFGRGPWYNCYTGLTLVHRSGIFGLADLIGNVEGGSNVITAHLECKR